MLINNLMMMMMIQPICVLYIYISVSVSPETSRGSECLLPATRRKSWPAFSPWDTTLTTSLPLSPCSGAQEWHSMKSVYQCTYSLWGSGLSSLHFFLFTVTHCSWRSRPLLIFWNNIQTVAIYVSVRPHLSFSPLTGRLSWYLAFHS